MRIGIDARFFGPLGKGLGRYTQKLIENLEMIDKNNQYFVFLKEENFNDYAPANSNFQKVLADYQWYTWEEQLKFPHLLNKYNLDLVHFTHFNVPILYRKKFLVTIHDLILLHFPTLRSYTLRQSTLHPFIYWLKFLAYRLVINRAIRKSNQIISVSKFTKNDILKNYPGVAPEKITVTYEACEGYCMLSPNKDEEILSRYGIIKPYLMYVGNAYPHKNLERLVSAFRKIKKAKPDLTLVFVGKEDYFYLRLKRIVEERKIEGVLFTGYVPDHDLDIFFHNVAVYVWPSLYEGFGLSPLEAMAKGAPVASSNHPCMNEILGDSALYFNAENEEEISDTIIGLIDNQKLRQDLIQKGYLQTRKYSWKAMAKETLDIYQTMTGVKNEK